jgi:mycofactocin system glycosyltransferase
MSAARTSPGATSPETPCAAPARATPCPAPATLPVALDPAVRLSAGGRVLIGGSPLRVISLTHSGARVVSRWRVPSPVGDRSGERDLARRLLEAGVLTPHPAPALSTPELTIVVPVRDRVPQLERCLEAIRRACPDSPIVVVDDGSRRPGPVRAACDARGARLIRHHRSRGPAAARNAGLAACATPFVGFVDSDVVLPDRSPHRLLGHLCDPSLGAVAPRVRALTPEDGLIGAYEGRHSALDMGPRSGLAAPGRPVSYVPSAVLFARRSAIGDGFDESLRTGEDVDLVWRLCQAGWRVRYASEVDVWHEHRVSLREFMADRRRYARSGGHLARRHPGAAAAMWVSPELALPWVLALAGRPQAALTCIAGVTVRHRHRLRRVPGSPAGLAGMAVAHGLAATGLALGHAVRRAWAPPLLALGRSRPQVGALVLAAFAVPVIEDAVAARDPRTLPADAGLRLLEELIALAGTWEGCIRGRTIRPLLPSWRRPAPAPA